MPTDQNIIKVNINDIVPSKYQPRKVFNEESIKELALSIKNYGILNPLLVRKISSGYEIIAGERRYRAAKMLGLTEVPVLVKELSDNEVRELALIENIQRNNLNPIEEAEAFKEILSTNTITQEELSQKIGKSQSVISNKIRLLNLSTEVRDAILNGKISEHHGRILLKLTEEEQNQVLQQIIDNKLSVKSTEELINKKNSKENIKNVLNSIDIDITNSNTFNDLEQEIKEKGEENMNNNLGMGSFFPQMDNSNPNMNNNLNNDTILFNSTPINNSIPTNDAISFNNNATTVPLNTLNQEPAISTIPNMNDQTIPVPETNEQFNIQMPQFNPTMPETNNKLPQPEVNTIPERNNQNIEEMNNNQTMLNTPPLFANPQSIEVESINNNSHIMPTGTLETPLFTNQVSQPDEPSVSINVIENTNPSEITSYVEKTSIDKIKEVLNNLQDSNVNYKEYSNNTEKCIIISIKQ